MLTQTMALPRLTNVSIYAIFDYNSLSVLVEPLGNNDGSNLNLRNSPSCSFVRVSLPQLV